MLLRAIPLTIAFGFCWLAVMPLSDLWASEPEPKNSPNHDSDDGDDASVQKLRRFCKTAKARAASLLSRQARKIERAAMANANSQVEAEASATQVFQQKFLASDATQWDPLEDMGPASSLLQCDESNGRRRAVFYYLKAVAQRVKQVFHWESSSASARPHCISIHTADDANMKFGSGARGSTEIQTVMANIQEHVVTCSASESECDLTWFNLHQPIVPLDRADTVGLYRAFMGWILGFSNYVGWRWQCWGIPPDLFRNVARHTVVFVGDALKANSALFKILSQCIHEQEKGPDASTQSCCLQILCNIHQVSLTRKNVALGFQGYFSCLVRLGHLFEGHNFRQKFHAAMSKLVQSNFEFIIVGNLPNDVQRWHDMKVQQLRLHTDTGFMGYCGRNPTTMSRRLRVLWKHIEKDNGDPESDKIVHWCTGGTCCPGGREEALSTLIASFLDLFSHMCVPLLYRWKHAGSANNFVRDGFILHRILPRTLQAMPSVKCPSDCYKFKTSFVFVTRTIGTRLKVE